MEKKTGVSSEAEILSERLNLQLKMSSYKSHILFYDFQKSNSFTIDKYTANKVFTFDFN